MFLSERSGGRPGSTPETCRDYRRLAGSIGMLSGGNCLGVLGNCPASLCDEHREGNAEDMVRPSQCMARGMFGGPWSKAKMASALGPIHTAARSAPRTRKKTLA